MKRKWLLLLAPTMLLTSCADAIQKDDIVDKLIPNWTNFVVQLAAFLVLVFVIIFFAYKPVKKIIKKRQDYIDDNIKQSEIAKSRANDNIIKSEDTLTKSLKQANEIVEKAKLDAEKERAKLLEETDKEISRLKEEADKDIERSKLEAKEEIRKEMVNLALDASSEILSRNVNSKDNAKLADEFIRSIEK